MKSRLLAVALLAAAATPALAQGIDSQHSPYPPSAYSGFVPARQAPRITEGRVTSSAYRFSGQHAGGPADALSRG